MKKTSTLPSSSPHKHKGVTLIELSVVISVVLVLISALMVLTTYYTKAADKSACIVNINALQKSIRSYQNIKGLKLGDPVTLPELVGSSKPLSELPKCPTEDGAYSMPVTKIPAVGQPAVICTDFDSASGSIDKNEAHNPHLTSGW